MSLPNDVWRIIANFLANSEYLVFIQALRVAASEDWYLMEIIRRARTYICKNDCISQLCPIKPLVKLWAYKAWGTEPLHYWTKKLPTKNETVTSISFYSEYKSRDFGSKVSPRLVWRLARESDKTLDGRLKIITPGYEKVRSLVHRRRQKVFTGSQVKIKEETSVKKRKYIQPLGIKHKKRRKKKDIKPKKYCLTLDGKIPTHWKPHKLPLWLG